MHFVKYFAFDSFENDTDDANKRTPFVNGIYQLTNQRTRSVRASTLAQRKSKTNSIANASAKANPSAKEFVKSNADVKPFAKVKSFVNTPD